MRLTIDGAEKMDAQGLHSWITLKNVPGIGNLLFKRLITRCGTPERVLRTARKKPQTLHTIAGITPHLISAMARADAPHWTSTELEKVQEQGYRIITLNDPDYPYLLAQIPDPPPYLYVAGNLPQTNTAIAMVGSRKPTSYGRQACQKLSAQLARKGVAIISGLALGIDSAAHKGALSADSGKTVAVLGSGLACIYPPQNRALFEQIIRNGAVVSEFALFARPEAHHFPQRNRVISGLSLGTVVVEAADRSGSLITARLAAEQNREVFAVPGSIDSFESAGTHQLIQQGAKLVTKADDILEEFGQPIAPVMETPTTLSPPSLNTEQAQIHDLLTPYPVHIDMLVKQSGLAAGTVSSILLQLELLGVVLQSSGKRFSLRQS